MPDVPGFALQCEPVAYRLRWQSQRAGLMTAAAGLYGRGGTVDLASGLEDGVVALDRIRCHGQDFFCSRSALPGIGLDVGQFEETALRR